MSHVLPEFNLLLCWPLSEEKRGFSLRTFIPHWFINIMWYFIAVGIKRNYEIKDIALYNQIKNTCLLCNICFYFSIQGWPQLSFQSHWQTTLVGSILGPRLVCLLLAKALTHLHTDLTPQVKAIHLVHFCQDAIREKLCPQESNLR